MRTVGACEARRHLSRLLRSVAAGESITITRHGIPVAVLSPVASEAKPEPDAVVDAVQAFRRRYSLDGMSLRAMVEEGRG